MFDKEIRVCELFAGIGGFRFGLEKASCRFKTVYANELDKYAAAIYRHNYNDETLHEADVHTVNPQDIPDCDLIVGGFPCQPFSVAGKRQGIADPRGTLFQEILRFTRAKRPKMLLLENVPGLLSINRGAVFETIVRSLGELGYICEWKVLDSQNFGVPQQRRRVYIVGYLTAYRGGGGTVFPIPNGSPVGVTKTNGQRCSTITAGYQKRRRGDTFLIVNCMFGKTQESVDVSPTLCARMGMGSGNVPLAAVDRIRRFTPVECERLQGFPNDWTRYGLSLYGEKVEISNMQRYKTLGNAVTTNVVTAIGRLILDFMEAQ